jgi:hypothetical protein
MNYCRLVLLGITPKGEAVSGGFYFREKGGEPKGTFNH